MYSMNILNNIKPMGSHKYVGKVPENSFFRTSLKVLSIFDWVFMNFKNLSWL